MSKFFFMLLCLIFFSCYKTNVVQYETWNQDPASKACGLQINAVQRQYNGGSGKNFYLNMMKQCGQIQKIITVIFQI